MNITTHSQRLNVYATSRFIYMLILPIVIIFLVISNQITLFVVNILGTYYALVYF